MRKLPQEQIKNAIIIEVGFQFFAGSPFDPSRVPFFQQTSTFDTFLSRSDYCPYNFSHPVLLKDQKPFVISFKCLYSYAKWAAPSPIMTDKQEQQSVIRMGSHGWCMGVRKGHMPFSVLLPVPLFTTLPLAVSSEGRAFSFTLSFSVFAAGCEAKNEKW